MSGEETESSERVLTRREAIQGGSAVVATTVGLDAVTARVMAQSGGPTNEISGVVEDDSGAVDGATVAAVPHDESLAILETTTAADGTYTFDDQALHQGENLYHVIARDGTESSPRRGEQNYPFIAAEGVAAIPDGAVLRVKAEDLTSSLNDAATVSTWSDTSGNSNDLSASGDPTLQTGELNGRAVVRYDGSGDFHSGPSLFSGDESRTVAVVLAASTGSSTPALAGQAGGTESTDNWFQLLHRDDLSDDEQINLFGNNTNFGIQKAPPVYAMATYDGTTVRTYKNGSAGSTNTTTLSTNANQFYVGARDRASGEDNYLDGDIAEVVVYPRELSSSERSDLVSYFNNEYGL